MKPIIDAGYLYIACPPLFKVSKGTGKNEKVLAYLYSQEELDNYDTTGCNVSRYKGLGEMNPEQLWETTMDPARARLIQITLEDCEAAERALEVCMSNNIEARKEFIIERTTKEEEN